LSWSGGNFHAQAGEFTKFIPYIMKHKFLATMLGVTIATGVVPARAEDDPAINTAVKDVITKVRALNEQKKQDERDYADLLKQLDDIVAQHKDQKTDQVASILMLEASIYQQVLTNADRTDKAIAVVGRIKTDFPDTRFGTNTDKIIASFKAGEAAEKIQAGLVAGAAFPDFDETDFNGKHVSVADHKGKLVLIDFWATWCPPCRAEFPNVKKTYETYHDKGFDIIGISLDDDKGKLTDYIKENGVVWQQYFDGKGWENKLAAKYGIRSIPATILIDSDGKILGKDLRGDDLSAAVAKAIASKGGA
jgi:thiol-disulfide isomerase/thioredoxin